MPDREFFDAARALIAADTVTERGNLRAVDVLEPLFQDAGLPTRRLPSLDSADRDANFLAGPGGAPDGDALLLVTHLDTVDPGPRERWRTDPFAFRIDEDGSRAYGLGVADVKLDALCKLWAIRRLKGVSLKRPFYFLGTYGEEAGLRGARAFMQAPPIRPFAVLCGEPSELRICHAHKGYAVARVRLRTRKPTSFAASPSVGVTFEGKAAHSSTPHLGINAIDRALDSLSVAGSPYAMFLSGGASANTIPARCDAVVYSRAGCGPSLPWAVETPDAVKAPESDWANVTTMLPLMLKARQMWRDRVAALQPVEDARFKPPGAVANVTKVRTSRDTVELTFDARLLPEHDAEGFVTSFQRDAEQLSNDDVEVRVEIDRRANGMSAAVDSPLVRELGAVLQSLGLEPSPLAKPTSTEAGVFARSGIPAVVFGPSLSTGNAHTANEFARLDEVRRAVDVYEQVIRKLCG